VITNRHRRRSPDRPPGRESLLEREPDLKVVGEANDGIEGVRLVERLLPSILDPGSRHSGAGTASMCFAEVSRIAREVKVIVLSNALGRGLRSRGALARRGGIRAEERRGRRSHRGGSRRARRSALPELPSFRAERSRPTRTAPSLPRLIRTSF